MTKICIKCGIEKEDSEFVFRNKKKQIRRTTCKVCLMEYNRKHYKENKSKYILRARNFSKKQRKENRQKLFDFLKLKKCVDCGNDDVRVLEFDHKSRLDKFSTVCNMINRYNWKTILKEIDKCEIRCANCHKIKTSIQFNWFKNQ
jgi:hypothetical protein